MTINQLIELNHPKVNILLDKYFNKDTVVKFKAGDYFFEPAGEVYIKVKDVIIEKSYNTKNKVKIYYTANTFVYQENIRTINLHEQQVLESGNLNVVNLDLYKELEKEYDTTLPF